MGQVRLWRSQCPREVGQCFVLSSIKTTFDPMREDVAAPPCSTALRAYQSRSPGPSKPQWRDIPVHIDALSTAHVLIKNVKLSGAGVEAVSISGVGWCSHWRRSVDPAELSQDIAGNLLTMSRRP
ncbi:hypothetical protein N8E89_23345 (plasmid) [Phyllobacterium sp. A18/5-2]|uniref:hypothetical protein n=1 Tax=Phyllobacterium sp. A18/5-2 TaxID=2978392 RepID=UPI0021C5E9AD|nr:hypothetical protein [Phyllobacterium sp. A18/5-2]UXN66143.1 hypothetical protein N8E89_23345 [Phyllobacterium sp. A18/5-2]